MISVLEDNAKLFVDSATFLGVTFPIYDLNYTFSSLGVVELLLAANDNQQFAAHAHSYIAVVICKWIDKYKTIRSSATVRDGKIIITIKNTKKLLTQSASCNLEIFLDYSQGKSIIYFGTMKYELWKHRAFLQDLSLAIALGFDPYFEGKLSKPVYKEGDINSPPVRTKELLTFISQEMADSYKATHPNEPLGSNAVFYEGGVLFPAFGFDENTAGSRALYHLKTVVESEQISNNELLRMTANWVISPSSNLSLLGYCLSINLCRDADVEGLSRFTPQLNRCYGRNVAELALLAHSLFTSRTLSSVDILDRLRVTGEIQELMLPASRFEGVSGKLVFDALYALDFEMFSELLQSSSQPAELAQVGYIKLLTSGAASTAEYISQIDASLPYDIAESCPYMQELKALMKFSEGNYLECLELAFDAYGKQTDTVRRSHLAELIARCLLLLELHTEARDFIRGACTDFPNSLFLQLAYAEHIPEADDSYFYNLGANCLNNTQVFSLVFSRLDKAVRELL